MFEKSMTGQRVGTFINGMLYTIFVCAEGLPCHPRKVTHRSTPFFFFVGVLTIIASLVNKGHAV